MELLYEGLTMSVNCCAINRDLYSVRMERVGRGGALGTNGPSDVATYLFSFERVFLSSCV